MAALAFVPPVVFAVGYALYQKAFSEEDQMKHSITAGILWDRTKAIVAPAEHPVLDGVEILGVRDDDSFFHLERNKTTRRFFKFWKESHQEGPFQDDMETVLKALGPPEGVIRCEIRFFYKEGVDEVDRQHYEATYCWQKGQSPRLLAFPVYSKSKTEEAGGVVFVQKVIYASLSKPDGKNELVVTNLIARLAGPRGNFYQDVPEHTRPTVNLSLAFMEQQRQGYRYLKLVDTLGLTYRYDLEETFIAQWPTDGPHHIWVG